MIGAKKRLFAEYKFFINGELHVTNNGSIFSLKNVSGYRKCRNIKLNGTIPYFFIIFLRKMYCIKITSDY